MKDHHCCHHDNNNSFALGAIVGLAAGVFAGIMLAPGKGPQNREVFKTKSKKLITKAKEKGLESALEDLNKDLEPIKTILQTANDSTRKKIATELKNISKNLEPEKSSKN